MRAHRSQKIKEVADPDVSQTQRLLLLFVYLFNLCVPFTAEMPCHTGANGAARLRKEWDGARGEFLLLL